MPKATKRERQRQNRDTRRAAMQAEEKRRRRFRTIRLFAIIIAAAVALAFVVSLLRGGGDDSKQASSSTITCTDKKPSNAPTSQQFSGPPPMTIDPTATYTVTLDTSCGDVPITLDAASSPQTVNNFVFLAQQGFYDGTTFHRIVTDFVDQGGSPDPANDGGPGYSLPDEPVQRAYQGGDVAMARSTATGVSGSQFFLVVSDKGATGLGGPPGQYNLLGTMSTQGLKVAQKINTFGGSDEAGTPTKTIYVFSAKVSGPTATSSTTSSTTTTAAP